MGSWPAAKAEDAPPTIDEREAARAFLAPYADEMARIRVGLDALSEHSLEAYVAKVGSRVAPVRSNEEGELVFYVAVGPEPNAFALADGTIVVHTGLLAVLQNEAQLAPILGHAIAHVTKRQSFRSFRSAQRAKQPAFGLRAAAVVAHLTLGIAVNRLRGFVCRPLVFASPVFGQRAAMPPESCGDGAHPTKIDSSR